MSTPFLKLHMNNSDGDSINRTNKALTAQEHINIQIAVKEKE